MHSRAKYRFLLVFASCLFPWLLLELAALVNLVDYRTLLGGAPSENIDIRHIQE